MIRGLIFDLDGVLVDAIDWHYESLNRALKLFGYSISQEEQIRLYNGLPTAAKLEILSLRHELPRGLHGLIQEKKQSFFREKLVQCGPNPAIKAALEKLKAKGYALAVASNSIRATVTEVLSRMEVLPYFEFVLSNEDVVQPKPSREIYDRAVEKLGICPEECLVFEDNAYGIQSARQVTPNVCFVSSPRELSLDFIEKAVHRFERPEAFSYSRRSLKILIPMAGLGTRFQQAGYRKPKPFIEVLGRPMIQWVVENVYPSHRNADLLFLCRRDHVPMLSQLDFLSNFPGFGIRAVNGVTEGALCTMLLARDALESDGPLLIANSDQWIDADIEAFIDAAENNGADGTIMTFSAADPKWSFAKLGRDGWVEAVAEKIPISHHATTGIYYFKRAKDFVAGAEAMIRKNIRTKNEFYVCPVYNELIEQGKKIAIHSIPESAMHGLGTPEDFIRFVAQKRLAQQSAASTAPHRE